MGIDERLRVRVHQEYFHSILQRDLILRHDVEHPSALRDLALRLMHDNASLHSLNRLTETLKGMGHSLSKTFVQNCLEWLHDAYLFFPLPIFTNSHTKRQANPKKWYAIDPALVRSVASKYTSDSDRLLENLVYLSLRRRGLEPSYVRTRSGKEVDFIYQDEGSWQLLQVCWSLTEAATRKRELSALEHAFGETDADRAVVVTWRESEMLKVAGKPVEVVPAWRYLAG